MHIGLASQGPGVRERRDDNGEGDMEKGDDRTPRDGGARRRSAPCHRRVQSNIDWRSPCQPR